jgi:hypothetical protein
LIAEEVVHQTNYNWALRQSHDNNDEHDNLPHDDHEEGEE